MGEARRRGSFEERKSQAIERGDSKERGRRTDARQRVQIGLYTAQVMAHMLANQGRSL